MQNAWEMIVNEPMISLGVLKHVNFFLHNTFFMRLIFFKQVLRGT